MTDAGRRRPDIPRFEGADQTGNPKPHDYRKEPTGYAFCLSCGLVRQASGSTDKKP